MESVNKVFDGVEKSLEKYESVDSGSILEDAKLCQALSVEVVSGLTDILKNVLSKPKFEKSEPISFASLLTCSVVEVMVYYGALPGR